MSYNNSDLIEKALSEDLGTADITTRALIPDTQEGHALIMAKEQGVVAGTEVARQVFFKVDPSINVTILIPDGTPVQTGDLIARLYGKTNSILTAERVALNFLQHLSGIASLTARYVKAIEGLPTMIVDTRKTLPGMRELQKEAVRCGGGKNHRMRLDDGVLIKDNHITALHSTGKTLADMIVLARNSVGTEVSIEIEVTSVEQAAEALEAGADTIMLDNMDIGEMKKAVELIKGRAKTEASGGITLVNVRSVAETGVDIISVGALTHSVRALDICLKLQ